MHRFFRSALWGVLLLTLFGNVFAARGDFGPKTGLRSGGITTNYNDAHGTGSSVQYNLLTDDFLYPYLKGYCNSTDQCKRLGSQYKDERDFLTLKKKGSTVTNFLDTVDQVQAGDALYAMIYLHNNAVECRSTDWSCLRRNTAEDVKVSFDWSDPSAIRGEIASSSMDAPSGKRIWDMASLGGDMGNLKLKLGSQMKVIRNDGNTAGWLTNNTKVVNVPEVSGTSFEYNLGNHRSCYGYVALVVVRFDVVEKTPEELCGNGDNTDPGEGCDLGDEEHCTEPGHCNGDPGSGCSDNCQIVGEDFCGNGTKEEELGEGCDLGDEDHCTEPGHCNGDPGSGCSLDCQIVAEDFCGNGTKEEELGEGCDLGDEEHCTEPGHCNGDPGSGCSLDCQIVGEDFCGNGTKEEELGEGCDLGDEDHCTEPGHCNGDPGSGCSIDCQIVGEDFCGNGTKEEELGEGCDLGDEEHCTEPGHCNGDPGSGCSIDCQIVGEDFCGNGTKEEELGEGCDLGDEEHCTEPGHCNGDPGSGCSDNCQIVLYPTKTADPVSGSTVFPGDMIRYYVAVENIFDDTFSYQVEDPLDDEVVFTSASGEGITYEDGTVTLDYELAALETQTKVFGVTVLTTAQPGDEIVNQVGDSTVRHIVGGGVPDTLDIEKTADPRSGSTVALGEEIEYRIAVENISGEAQEDIVLMDVLDPNVTFASGEGSGLTHEDGVVTMAFDLGVGESREFRFTVTVDTDAPAGTAIVNRVDDSTVVHYVADDRIITEKTADPRSGSTVARGEEIEYRIRVQNVSAQELTGYRLEDVLDDEVDFLSAGGDTDITVSTHDNGAEVVSLVFDLAPGQEEIKHFTVSVRNDAAYGAAILNAVVGSDTVVHYVNDPAISAIKRADPRSGSTVRRGEEIEYRLDITNVSDEPLVGHRVLDVLDDQVAFESNNGDADITHYGGIVTVNLNLGVGETATKTFTVKVRDTAPAGSVILNSVVNSNTVWHYVADDRIITEKTADPRSGSTVQPGDSIEYRIRVRNVTDAVLTDYVITDVLDEEVTFVEEGDINVVHYGGIVYLNFGDLQPQQDVIRTFTVAVRGDAEPGAAILNAVVGSNTVVHYVDDPAISAVKTADPESGSTVDTGDTIEYTLDITNVSDEALVGHRVLDVLDDEIEFGSNGGDESITHYGGIVMIDLDLPAGETITKSFTVTVRSDAEPGAVIVNAIVNSNSVWHYVSDDRLTTVKSADPVSGSTVFAGQEITYTVGVTANENLIRYELLDYLDDNLEYVSSADTRVSVYGNIVTVDLDLEAGESTEIIFIVRVRVGTPRDTVIRNSVVNSNIVTHTVGDGVPTDGRIRILKEGAPAGPLNWGSFSATDREIDYTLTLTNVTNDPANGYDPVTFENIELQDSIDLYVEFLETERYINITGFDRFEDERRTIVFNLDTLTPGESVSVTFPIHYTGSGASDQGFCNGGLTPEGTVVGTATEQGTGDAAGPFRSNQVCHGFSTGGTTPGGPGGNTRYSTMGVCTQHLTPDDGIRKFEWQCGGDGGVVMPYEDPGDANWTDYQACVRDGTAEYICARDWAEAKGYIVCNTGNAYAAGLNTAETTPRVTNICEAACTEPACIDATSAYFEALDIQKKVSADDAAYHDQVSLAKGEPAYYDVKVRIRNPKPEVRILEGSEAFDLHLERPRVVIHDCAVSSESGWIWPRLGLEEASTIASVPIITQDRTEGTDCINITLALTDENIQQLNTNGSTVVGVSYEINTNLAFTVDADKLENVAIARAYLPYADETAGSYGDMIAGVVPQDALPICDFLEVDPSSYGALTTVNIIRPFVQAKGGSNIGMNFTLAEDVQRPFGSEQGDLKGVSTGEVITSSEGYGGKVLADFTGLGEYAQDKDTFFTRIKNNASEQLNLSGAQSPFRESKTFRTLPSGEGVYLSDESTETEYTLASSYTPVVSQLFILDDGVDVHVTSDFDIQGPNFVAFILRGGDLIIDEDVSELNGIFIVDGGAILSDGQKTNTQLKVSGGMMGNARDLLEKRIFIGLEPLTKLEPSVLISFDSRLLQAMPPKLNEFLGGDWKQSQ